MRRDPPRARRERGFGGCSGWRSRSGRRHESRDRSSPLLGDRSELIRNRRRIAWLAAQRGFYSGGYGSRAMRRKRGPAGSRWPRIESPPREIHPNRTISPRELQNAKPAKVDKDMMRRLPVANHQWTGLDMETRAEVPASSSGGRQAPPTIHGKSSTPRNTRRNPIMSRQENAETLTTTIEKGWFFMTPEVFPRYGRPGRF